MSGQLNNAHVVCISRAEAEKMADAQKEAREEGREGTSCKPCAVAMAGNAWNCRPCYRAKHKPRGNKFCV